MSNSNDKILWVDCLGGLIVGCVVLSIYKLLNDWESLPTSIVVSMGVANLAYGSYSLFVTTRNPRPLMMVKLLAVANMFWLIVCLAIATAFWRQDICLGDTARGWRGHLCCRAWIGPMEMANASCRPKTRGFEFDQLSRRHIPPTRCPTIEYHKQSTSHEPIAKSVSFSVSLRFRKCNRRKMPTMIPSKKLVRRPA